MAVPEAPNVLTIALKRFWSGKYGKLNKPIRFPEILDLVPFMSGSSDFCSNPQEIPQALQDHNLVIGRQPLHKDIFAFSDTKTRLKGGWVTIGPMFGRSLFNPHSNQYKNYKDIFVRVIGCDGTSMVTIWEDDIHHFHMSLTKDPMAITGCESDYITIIEREMVHFFG